VSDFCIWRTIETREDGRSVIRAIRLIKKVKAALKIKKEKS
jgi:hypothetical protein